MVFVRLRALKDYELGQPGPHWDKGKGRRRAIWRVRRWNFDTTFLWPVRRGWLVLHLKIKSNEVRATWSLQALAITSCKIKSNGCTTNEEVGNRVPDTPVKFQSMTHRIGRRRALFVWQGCARLCIVTTSDSTAGLRNETFETRYHAIFWGLQ